MLSVKYSIKFLLLILIIVNIIFSSIFLTQSRFKSYRFEEIDLLCNQSAIPDRAESNQITLNFNILDIYRIDISCEYITRDLGDRVSQDYMNTNRKCALASRKKYDRILSLAQYANSDQPTYVANFTNTEFNPFALDLKDSEVDGELLSSFRSLQPGGIWNPVLKKLTACQEVDLEFIAFIVPYSSNRLENLRTFISNIHSYLQTAVYKFKYQIIVVEQANPGDFNKGRLINRAVKYALDKNDDIDCIVIHDVDLIPTFDAATLKTRGDYRCRHMPLHMSNEVYLMTSSAPRVYNKFLTGGILSLRPKHFLVSNGFSNNYFGWGAEDDDFTLRMFTHHLCIDRSYDTIEIPNKSIDNKTPFTMLKHKKSKVNTKRMKTLTSSFWHAKKDGYSNIMRVTELKEEVLYPTFTHLLVDVVKRY